VIGYLRSIGFIADEPHTVVPVAATVESASEAGTDPSPSPVDVHGGRDAEPTTTELEVAFLRAGVQHHEVQRDLWLSALIFAEAALTRHRRTWDA
jgi:hypothetical protein